MKDVVNESAGATGSLRRLSGLGPVVGEASSFDESIEILGLIRALWHRKTLICAVCLATAFVFFVFAMLQPSSYTAVATVVLDPREQRVVASQDQVVSDLKLTSPILESEVAIVRSATLLARAVETVGLDRFNQMDPGFSPNTPIQNQGDTASDPSGLTPEQKRISRITAALRQGMNVRRVGDAYVIEMSITTPQATLSADTANALAQSYIEQQLQDRRRVAESATQWLAEQVAERRDELTRAEAAVETFKRGQLDLAVNTDAILEQQLGALNDQLVEARAARTTEEARLQQIEKLTQTQGALGAAETQQSPFILSLRSTRAELMQQDLRLAKTLGPQHPDRKLLAQEIIQLDTSIRNEVENVAQAYRNEVSVLQLREDALQREVTRIQADMSGNANASISLRQLERESDAARATYEEMTTRLGETRAQAEIQRAEARIVNLAQVPLAPSGPRIKLLTAFGATLGLTAGLIAALSIEMVSSGFISRAEVERATGLPVLTTIPLDDLPQPSVVLEKVNGQAFSLFAERIRQLRTMLEMGGWRQGSHVTAVLSSLPNEGKTTTALALARSYAMTGKKTLLLDLDTRRSKLTNALAQTNLGDLGDFLAGDVALRDVIHHDPNLGFSVAGSSNYTAILADSVSATVLNDLLGKFREDFEIIIIDSPPVLAVSDGLEIASISDSILYLVQHRKTARRSVFYGLAALRHLGIRPTGIVLTQAQISADPDNYAGEYTYR